MCVHVCVHARAHTYVTFICIHVLCLSVCPCVYVWSGLYVSVYMHVSVSVYELCLISVCVCVCVCVCVSPPSTGLDDPVPALFL